MARAGWLRAAVLGANDGIVSTASLVIGVASASESKTAVLVAGVAGLVAGAMSMAAGEYVSVSSQADTERADLARSFADVREGGFLKEFPRVFRRLQSMAGITPRLIFLEANPSTLVRRFSETRRPHPLAPDRSVAAGIHEERAKMNSIRAMADLILDTSNLTVHELRDVFMRMSRDQGERAAMVVTLVSFGYKNGVPLDADLVFDVRCLPNPHFVETLRPLTGRDRAVVRYMRRYASTREFLDRLTAFLKFALPQYVQEGKSYLTVAIGCTGGRHRSVMIAEELKKTLAGVKGITMRVKHRDS